MIFGNDVFQNTKLRSERDSEKFYREAVLWDELLQTFTTVEEMTQFLNTDEAKAMMECGYITEANSVVVLSKLDDLSRRTEMAALQLAEEKNDPMWKAYKKHRAKEKALKRKMAEKYSAIATKNAKKAQKEYIKLIPNAFRRRVTVAPLKVKE